MGYERKREDSHGNSNEPHGLNHISEVLDYILGYERNGKSD